MTYATLKQTRGRIPFTIVELVMDYCSNTYGSAPCTAAGSVKCFNTFATCQDTANFTASTKTYRFCTNVANLPAGLFAFPCVQDVNLAASKIETDGIGQRASITVTMKDFPYHDRGIDPYVDERTYDPKSQGSFWGRFKARNKFYLNRKLVVRTGYIDPTGFDTTLASDFQARTYFIERIEGPDYKGTVKIIAKDILKLTNKAKAPLPSDGTLNADITNSDTSLTLASGYSTSYGTSGTIKINEEIMSYSGKSGDTLTGLTRGLYNTVADAHSTDDSVQICLLYSSAKTSDILEDLLTTYAGVDASYIDSVTWEAENDEKLASHSLTVVIPEPTDVKKLCQEVLQSTLSYIWWDEEDQEIKFKVAFPVDLRTTVTQINDVDNILDGSLTIKDDESKRISEVIVYYNQIDPTEELKKKNFSNIYASLDSDAESTNEYGVKSTIDIVSRWQTASGAVIEVGGRTLNLYASTPRMAKFRLDAKDSDLKAGDIVAISSRSIQSTTGESLPVNFLVTKKAEVELGSTYEYEALEFAIGGKVGYVGPDTLSDYTLESAANQAAYGFISQDDGEMTNGDEGYKIA